MRDDVNPAVNVIEYQRPGIGRGRRFRTFGEEVTKVAALAALFVYYGLRASREKGADFYFFGGVLLWVGVGIAIAARRWNKRREPSHVATSAVWRLAIAFLFAASVAFFVVPLHTPSRYTCAHGTRWANNQLAIAWSDNGGPCGNGPYQRVGRPWRIAKHWYIYRPHVW